MYSPPAIAAPAVCESERNESGSLELRRRPGGRTLAAAAQKPTENPTTLRQAEGEDVWVRATEEQ